MLCRMFTSSLQEEVRVMSEDIEMVKEKAGWSFVESGMQWSRKKTWI